MVDAADHNKIEIAKYEMFRVLDRPQMEGIPVLVLANKCDLPNAISEQELIEQMWDAFKFSLMNNVAFLHYIYCFPQVASFNWSVLALVNEPAICMLFSAENSYNGWL
mgnify:CR=1 FL=1